MRHSSTQACVERASGILPDIATCHTPRSRSFGDIPSVPYSLVHILQHIRTCFKPRTCEELRAHKHVDILQGWGATQTRENQLEYNIFAGISYMPDRAGWTVPDLRCSRHMGHAEGHQSEHDAQTSVSAKLEQMSCAICHCKVPVARAPAPAQLVRLILGSRGLCKPPRPRVLHKKT